jgi:hypothetical protein
MAERSGTIPNNTTMQRERINQEERMKTSGPKKEKPPRDRPGGRRFLRPGPGFRTDLGVNPKE